MSHPGSLAIAIRDVMFRAAREGDTDSLCRLARSIPYWAERLSLADQGQVDTDWRLVEGPDTDGLHAVIREYRHLLIMPGQSSQWRAATLMLYAGRHPEMREIIEKAETTLNGPWLRSVWELPISSTISPDLAKSFSVPRNYSDFSLVGNGERVIALSQNGAVSIHDLATLENQTLEARSGKMG